MSSYLVQEIDEKISWEDAVSIAFLIVDKQEVGLTLCKKMESLRLNDINGEGCGIMQLIFHSLMRNGSSSWPLVVFQTLYLVGQKRILYDLGMDVDQEAKVLEEGHKIKAERRLLYNLIENLESCEQDHLARLLLDNTNMEEEAVVMEVLLFHLLVERRPEDICDLLIESFRSMNRADLETFYTSRHCGSSTCYTHRKRGETSAYYDQGDGLCVIINQKLFKAGSMLDNRLGTDRSACFDFYFIKRRFENSFF